MVKASMLVVGLVGCVGPEGLWVPPAVSTDAVALDVPTLEPTYEWVVDGLDLGTEGSDLDGDGEPDNALAAWATTVDPLVASARTAGTSEIVLRMDRVGDLSDDAAVDVGLFSVADLDGDGTLDDPRGLDVDGVPLANARTALVDGTWGAVLWAPLEVRVGDAVLQSSPPVYLSGESDGEDQLGVLAFGIHVDSLLPAMTALGLADDDLPRVEALADLDTNGDGAPDTLSAAFRFTAVPVW